MSIELYFQFVGSFFVLAIAAVALACAHNSVQARREGYRDRQYQKAVFRARVELGRMLIQDSYWLTTNKASFRTMHLLGTTLLKEGSYDISRFRKELETYEVN